jgi:hypothetical protein
MSDIERDRRFDSEDERTLDADEALDSTTTEPLDVHADPEAPEADVIDQHLEVPLDDDDGTGVDSAAD